MMLFHKSLRWSLLFVLLFMGARVSGRDFIDKIFEQEFANELDLLKGWRDSQSIYKRVSVKKMKKYLQKRDLSSLKTKLKEEITKLQAYSGLFEPKLSRMLGNYTVSKNHHMKKHFSHVYSLLGGKTENFISYLKKSGFLSKKVNDLEEKISYAPVIDKYTNVFDALFDRGNEKRKNEFLFTVSNRFFDYCFNPVTHHKFQTLFDNKASLPIVRLLYSVMWRNLAGSGWCHWHEESLKQLKKDADAGKEIVYIAGGTDIYQLLEHGIYNIRIIDPLLPTQPKYYSKSWDWFSQGYGRDSGVGERIPVKLKNREIFMHRVSCKPQEDFFTVKLSNKKTELIEKCITTWHLYDKKNKFLGKMIFDRRLTNQNDFIYSPNKSLLISFNEFYFISINDKDGGWGIDSKKFDDRLKIVVKQLEKPVDKKMACNFSKTFRDDKFSFMSLGTSIN